MNFLRKLYNYYRVGGIDLILFKVEDRVLKTDHAFTYMEEVFAAADEKDYPQLVEAMYELSTGKKLNLNCPRTFNEKIQWLKAYDVTPQKTRLADKFLVSPPSYPVVKPPS